MNLQDRRLVAGFRAVVVVAVLAGVVLTASGPATVAGMLPYFTIQSSLALGLFAAYAVACDVRGAPQPPALLKGAVTLYVSITGLVYHLVLANPASGFANAEPGATAFAEAGNQLLHTVVPVLAVLDWLLFDGKRRYRWRDPFYWLAYPFGYLGFALLRGLVVHTYPYPFVDVGTLGYDGVALSALGFGSGFYLLGLAFVTLDRLVGRYGPAPATANAG